LLLRLFGAKLGSHVQIRPSVRIIMPWHLEIDDHTAIGDSVILYSLGKIKIGKYVTISQYAHLCTGSHETRTRAMTLTTAPITLGDDVWIATDAYVGPGVKMRKSCKSDKDSRVQSLTILLNTLVTEVYRY